MDALEEHELTSTRGAAFACWWSHRYTRGLPNEVRDRRIAEIASDVYEHSLALTGDRGSGRAITWRTARGIPADVIWRRQEKQAMRHAGTDPNSSRMSNTWAIVTQAWFAPLAMLLGAFNLLASLAVVQEEGAKMPGQVIGPVLMTTLALSLFTGLWLRWRAGRAIEARGAASALGRAAPMQPIGLIAAVLALAFVLLVIGVSTGLVSVFFIALAGVVGTVLVVGGRAIGRAFRSSDIADKGGIADGLVIVGTLPALALFWMVIPPLLALAVISGVVGTRPGRIPPPRP